MCFGVWCYHFFLLIRGWCLIMLLVCGVILSAYWLEEGVLMFWVCGVIISSP